MGTTNALAKYIGNEFVGAGRKGLAKAGSKAGSKSVLSSLVPSVASEVGDDIASKAGTDLASDALALGLSRNAKGNWLMDTTSWPTGGTEKLKSFVKPILGEDTPSYSRFLEQIGEGGYRGSLNGHTPGWYDDDGNIIKSTLDNIEGDGDILPKIYGDNREATLRGLLSLGNSGDEARKSASVIANYRGKPNELATIYRQAPKDINYGDWVGITDSYANLHEGNSTLNKLWSKEVPASDVYFAGDDINEWYYMPKEVQLDDDIAKDLDKAMGYLKEKRNIPVQQDNYTPLYHQTSANSLADFSLDKRSAGVSDATMPEGIFLKETNADIGLPGKNQLQLDAKLNNPLEVMNRDDLKAKLMTMNPKVAKYLRAEADLDNYYEKLSEEAQDAVDKAYEKMYYDKSDANKKAFAEATEKMKGIIPEWREKIRENAATSQKEIKKLLKENGYDGMIMDEDRGSFGRKVKSYLVLDKEQLRDNSVPVKFNKSSSKELAPATRLGKDLNSVAEAMREYKAKNMNKMADNMIDEYSNEIFDWAALRNKGEKAIDKIVGKDGLKKLKTYVEPAVNNAYEAGEYEANKAIATNFLNSANSDKIVEASRELLPPGTKIYRRGSKNGISWTTDEALAKSSRYDGEPLVYTLTKNDRYIAPQFIDILQRTIENENQVLFKLK